MKIGKRTYEVDWGHFAVLTLIAAFVIAYLIDTRATSLRMNNLLFVQPASIIALVLYLLILPQTLRRVSEDTPDGVRVVRDRGESAEPEGETWSDLCRVAVLVARLRGLRLRAGARADSTYVSGSSSPSASISAANATG